MTGISWLSGSTMPERVCRLLSSLRMTTRLPIGSMTSYSARLFVGFVLIASHYRCGPPACPNGRRDRNTGVVDCRGSQIRADATTAGSRRRKRLRVGRNACENLGGVIGRYRYPQLHALPSGFLPMLF